MNILVFDNYDSFTYNLVHLVEKITHGKVTVVRNDEIPLEQVNQYDKIILSPGPGIPEEAGLLLPLIKEYAPTKSIFGVCLGLQAIGQALGGSLINLSDVFHGVATPVTVVSREGRLFNGLPDQLEVGRYHSWVVDENNLPAALTITARDNQGFIMAMQHQQYDVCGVQFHPESVLTPDGERILRNWLEL
ncbi:aminodeoxychorismate/anthranilate synthase component II [Chitinophaga pendula]|uniref:anthranilate synthase component II n=1 Tax=Chitinophaga TaxID=79328 RepID=UPI000BB084B9|nr:MULTISPECIES: aminodeoxychorismate/anthranilate synthase component II [Chitinophaga]ASZ11426.1 aminodeoxychorismate/anthranilate synthase component II [Chitinophaga sp. MD30]UCJ05569.1 aminodeoxychorismate/anthranilate synthase component II [Chitinophaga pendula]